MAKEKKPYAVGAGFLRVIGFVLVILGAFNGIPPLIGAARNLAELLIGGMWVLGIFVGIVMIVVGSVIQKRKFIGEG